MTPPQKKADVFLGLLLVSALVLMWTMIVGALLDLRLTRARLNTEVAQQHYYRVAADTLASLRAAHDSVHRRTP
jgi:hypothetical protein